MSLLLLLNPKATGDEPPAPAAEPTRGGWLPEIIKVKSQFDRGSRRKKKPTSEVQQVVEKAIEIAKSDATDEQRADARRTALEELSRQNAAIELGIEVLQEKLFELAMQMQLEEQAQAEEAARLFTERAREIGQEVLMLQLAELEARHAQQLEDEQLLVELVAKHFF